MNLAFLENKFDKASYLVNMLVAVATGGKGETSEYEALRRELLSDTQYSGLVPPFVRVNRDLSSFWAFIKNKHPTYAERRTFLSEAFTPLLDQLEFGGSPDTAPAHQGIRPQSPDVSSTAVAAAALSVVARNKRKVFIVHGHDNAAKQEVSRFIESLGLQTIILHEQASGGRTVIEKIEHYSNDADFALVLYTPCDLGRGVTETKVPARPRARQNVVFEHGYLIAKLGRENVCALTKGILETPSDISGVVYVPLDEVGAWKQDVVKELRACGYTVAR
jgi:predicted nucleotide-binding protein